MQQVTLAIRGGGAKVPTIGALKAFEEHGIPISRVSGSSMGAVIAALIAVGKNAKEIEDLFKKYVTDFSTTRNSSIVQESVDKECGGVRFKDIQMPIYIVANEGGLIFPKAFVFSKETTPEVTLGVACRASCSIPLIYGRYNTTINGRKMKFYDGGMAANPLLPERDGSVLVTSSFEKAKPNKYSRYYRAWKEPEEKADLCLRPYIGKMGSLGTPKDIELSVLVGYVEAIRQMPNLRRILTG